MSGSGKMCRTAATRSATLPKRGVEFRRNSPKPPQTRYADPANGVKTAMEGSLVTSFQIPKQLRLFHQNQQKTTIFIACVRLTNVPFNNYSFHEGVPI